ncbi:succinyldiaminopimelate transaminase [Mycetocola sp. BIGb0189]|uniref:succinyldiaminopimelate transaminase n=1 Tax=Mycetocola sp. BIGb0189 TaxID=2940604 RepID=UPI00286E39D6|nr:succinyldiaminopimelate transaminase [Mycetocola sp. BIGb0189]MCS4275511.1 succinyldiaminopimelate transaminase [Mycetocola sp. BIGb0189]
MALQPLPDYPWDTLAPFIETAKSHPEGMIDLSIGSPVDPTPDVIRAALAEATDAHAYPTTIGTTDLRVAIGDWYARRRGASGLGVDAVLPTIGSKELVALLPFLLGLGAGDTVVGPRVAYPTYAIGAAIAGAEFVAADDPAEWPESTRLIWLNSPGNPDGRVWSIEDLAVRAERARELGAVIVNDECYAELGWDEPWDETPIPSILDDRLGDRTGRLAIYSLSKQSNLAGYRAGIVAGDSALIARLVTVRKHAGLIVPAPLQHAMTVALGDDAHVAAQREIYRARRAVLLPALEAAGFTLEGSEAGLYLWVTEGKPALESLGHLAELGIMAGPGHFYGDFSPQHVRLSLTASDADIARAATRLRARSTEGNQTPAA